MSDGWKVEVAQSKDEPTHVRISVREVIIVEGFVSDDLIEPVALTRLQDDLRAAQEDNAWLRGVIGEAQQDLDVPENADYPVIRAARHNAKITLGRVLANRPTPKGSPRT